jgi:hypothetical protein
MPRNDFDGDGRSDVLWRFSNGSVSTWLATEDGFSANSAFAGSDWRVLATGDFDGDGQSDILWRHDSGLVASWLGQLGGGFVLNDDFERSSNDWISLGTGDFNGDGYGDILWSEPESTGAMATWLGSESGDFVAGESYPLDPPHYVFFNSIGDFNGDGRDDLLWRAPSTGQVGKWSADENGELILDNAANPGGATLDWDNAGIGDFNGDGRDDILWRHASGAISTWLATASGGFEVDPANAFTAVPNDWRVIGVGNYDGEGGDDILWRHTSGIVNEWLGSEGGGFIGTDLAEFAAAGWLVQPNPSGAGEWDYY